MKQRTLRPATLAALALAAATSAAPVLAQSQPAPFTSGKPTAGKPMFDKDCVACHARLYNGDADRIYLRDERKVRSPSQLMAQIQVCNTELKTNYFPEEEEHLAAYLNLQYYKFKP